MNIEERLATLHMETMMGDNEQAQNIRREITGWIHTDEGGLHAIEYYARILSQVPDGIVRRAADRILRNKNVQETVGPIDRLVTIKIKQCLEVTDTSQHAPVLTFLGGIGRGRA